MTGDGAAQSVEASPPLFLGVYTAAKADRVVRAVGPARAAGWEIALHALDEVPDELADVTLCRGPGLRLDNLNGLCAEVGGLPRWVVFCDDDIEFVRGDVVRLVAEVEAAGFGVAQPAHVPGSHVSHPQTRLVKRSRARLVHFVEQGISVVAPAWSQRVLPFPPGMGMGWGVELDWMDLASEGCRAGVVDCVAIRHLDPVGERYDMDAERQRMAAVLRARGIDDLTAYQGTLATWRPWQRRPPWATR